MYQSVYQYYKKRIEETKIKLHTTKTKLYSIGTVRLLIFLTVIFAACLLHPLGIETIFLVFVIGAFFFLFFLLQYNKLQKRKLYQETSILCDENELKGLDYNFSSFDGAPEKINANHSFSQDLDIFGSCSLFQSINRTCTHYGKQLLIDWFENPLQEVSSIEIRQEAVKELSGKPEFMHHFQVLGLINFGKQTDYKEINDFVESSNWIRGRGKWKILGILIPFIWAILTVLVVFASLPPQILVEGYIVILLLSECYVKKINRLQEMMGRKIGILQLYSNLIVSLENERFQSKQLKELQAIFLQNQLKASDNLKKLMQLASELEQRSNFIVRILLNPLFLWDIRKSIRLEEWKEKYGKNLSYWIHALGVFDACCSLGIFTFNHPDYTFPLLLNTYFKLEGKKLGHPLMDRKLCVKNDIDIKKSPFFSIITGANMAGKSTYLRTVGVNFVLACIGAPVCAEYLSLFPAKLLTGLRTSDSLNDNESYFFAELNRLKKIIDELHAGKKLFIILDEILKGTNSIDKQKGSLALIQQLIKLQAAGIIATHDLLLGTLEKEFPDNVKNCCFEADIKNDTLSFAYQLKEGIAQNMNATFLMQKMGITV
jgi:Ca2+/Na+ antiporter